MSKALPLAAGLLALTLSAAAAPPIDDPEARIAGQLVSEIVVRTGPAWWTVSKGGRQVQVLGLMWSYPADRRWNQRTLERNAIAEVLDGEAGARPKAQYVAVANIRTLLAEGGVLDKLRQRGYQVRSPQD